MRIFTEFSVSFRERFTYIVYKKATIFFSFSRPMAACGVQWRKEPIGPSQNCLLFPWQPRSLQRDARGRVKFVHKLRFGLHLAPIRSRIARQGVMGQKHNRVEK